VTLPEDFLTSKWPGFFTALASPLVKHDLIGRANKDKDDWAVLWGQEHTTQFWARTELRQQHQFGQFGQSAINLPTTWGVEPYSAVRRQKIPEVHRIWYSPPCTPVSLCSILAVDPAVSAPQPAYKTSYIQCHYFHQREQQPGPRKLSFLRLDHSVDDLNDSLTDTGYSY